MRLYKLLAIKELLEDEAEHNKIEIKEVRKVNTAPVKVETQPKEDQKTGKWVIDRKLKDELISKIYR